MDGIINKENVIAFEKTCGCVYRDKSTVQCGHFHIDGIINKENVNCF